MKMAGNMWLTMIYHRFWFTNCRCSYPITKVLSGGTMPLVYGLWSSIPWEYPSIWVTMVPQFTCEIPDLKTSKWVTSQETLTLLVSVISAMIITNLKYQTSYIILLSWWVYFSMVKIKLLALSKKNATTHDSQLHLARRCRSRSLRDIGTMAPFWARNKSKGGCGAAVGSDRSDLIWTFHPKTMCSSCFIMGHNCGAYCHLLGASNFTWHLDEWSNLQSGRVPPATLVQK